MPTNQEFLTQLATESPDKLKAWFDAEHNDTLTAKNDVSGNSAQSNDGNVHLKDSENMTDVFIDSREKLEAEAFNLFNEWSTLSDDAAAFLTGCVAGFLERQAAITAHENTKLIEKQANTIIRLQQQVDRLTAERDNLAADLEEFMKSIDALRDRFRIASSAALDNAHEIQRIIDQFWND